jgi:hypothetical protein
MRTAEPLVPEPSSVEDEIAIEKLKIYKSPGIDQLLAEMSEVIRYILRSSNLLILSSVRKNCHNCGHNPFTYFCRG